MAMQTWPIIPVTANSAQSDDFDIATILSPHERHHVRRRAQALECRPPQRLWGCSAPVVQSCSTGPPNLLRSPFQVHFPQIKLAFKLPKGLIIDVAFVAQPHCGLPFDTEQFPHEAIVPPVMFGYRRSFLVLFPGENGEPLLVVSRKIFVQGDEFISILLTRPLQVGERRFKHFAAGRFLLPIGPGRNCQTKSSNQGR